jgi:hypothetical protein
MGNLALACDVLTSWLRRTEHQAVTGDDVELR